MVTSSPAPSGQPTSRTFRPVRELYRIGGCVATRVLTNGVAATIPVPFDGVEPTSLLVMYYIGNVRPGGGPVSPPHYAMEIDGVRGSIVRFWACDAEDLGIDSADAAIVTQLRQGVPSLPQGQRHGRRERLFDISPEVWRLFLEKNGSCSAPERETVLEYRQALAQITPPEVLLFYAGAARRFSSWLLTEGR